MLSGDMFIGKRLAMKRNEVKVKKTCLNLIDTSLLNYYRNQIAIRDSLRTGDLYEEKHKKNYFGEGYGPYL